VVTQKIDYVAKYYAADVIARQYETLNQRLLEPVTARLSA